jgi:hypothetical protein
MLPVQALQENPLTGQEGLLTVESALGTFPKVRGRYKTHSLGTQRPFAPKAAANGSFAVRSRKVSDVLQHRTVFAESNRP